MEVVGLEVVILDLIGSVFRGIVVGFFSFVWVSVG